jgi:hypothetical protein
LWYIGSVHQCRLGDTGREIVVFHSQRGDFFLCDAGVAVQLALPSANEGKHVSAPPKD